MKKVFATLIGAVMAIGMLCAFPTVIAAAPGDGGTLTGGQEMGAGQTVLGAELTSVGDEVVVKVKLTPPTSYGINTVQFVVVYDSAQLQLDASNSLTSTGQTLSSLAGVSGTKKAYGYTFNAGGSLYATAEITLKFKIQQGFLDNDSRSEVVVALLDPRACLQSDGSFEPDDENAMVVYATSIDDEHNPYGNGALTPITEIAGLETNGTAVYTIANAALTKSVSYTAGEAGEAVIGLPNDGAAPFDSGSVTYVVADAPSWDKAHPFIGWKLVSGEIGGARTRNLIVQPGEELTYVKTALVFEAQWDTLQLYSIVYDANGGETTAVDGDTYIAGELVTLAAASSVTAPDDHDFLGWSTSAIAADGAATYVVNADHASNNEITLYAVYRNNSVTNTAQPGSGNSGSGGYSPITGVVRNPLSWLFVTGGSLVVLAVVAARKKKEEQ